MKEFCSCNASNVLDGGKLQSSKPSATDQDPNGRANAGTGASVVSSVDKPSPSSSNTTGQNLNQQENDGITASATSGGGQPNPGSNVAEVRDHVITC